MSCPHGEWFKCEQCDEVDAAHQRGLEEGLSQQSAQLECTAAYSPTRLEYFAGLAMQGIVSRSSMQSSDENALVKVIAATSVKIAKALVAELDKQP